MGPGVPEHASADGDQQQGPEIVETECRYEIVEQEEQADHDKNDAAVQAALARGLFLLVRQRLAFYCNVVRDRTGGVRCKRRLESRGHDDPEDDIGEYADAGMQGEYDEDQADEDGVYIEIVGQSAAYAADHFIVRVAIESLFHGVLLVRPRCRGNLCICTENGV